MNTSAIRLARMVRGWTQAQLAKKLGIDRTTLSRVETGFVEPGPELKKRIAEVLFWLPLETIFPDRFRVEGQLDPAVEQDKADGLKKEERAG